MNTAEALQLQQIMREAERERGRGDRAYEKFKRRIAALNLRADEYESAVRKLATALRY